ncbi:spore germination protein [Peribacillus huizhouensis]|uniref:Spore germination protein n=1 Tax=Peribacillus huizhouensis TaxID=1501239 RepID=A0ABR6CQB3_9BACI|nr:hypothetical protein [Peribacillus huizhouensis]
MSIFLGPININNINGSAIVHFGPVAFISPKSVEKTIEGSGSSNKGALIFNCEWS